MVTIKADPVGTVTELLGTALRADVDFGGTGEQLAGYEIELTAGHKGDRATKAWSEKLWSFDSRNPRFESVAGQPAFHDMKAKWRRPEISVSVSEPIDAYRWVIRQDNRVLEKSPTVTDGIAADGLSFSFRPVERIRRSGQPARVPEQGVFYPPIDTHLPDVPRTNDTRIEYTALTHAGHTNEDAYAVDLNWGGGTDDKRHWVRAAADGVVYEIRRDNGEIRIRHPKFDGSTDYQTIYAHMTPKSIEKVQLHDRIRAQQRIGRIGNTYYKGTYISPHLHHQHRRNDQPIKMKLVIGGKETAIGVSRPNPQALEYWNQRIRGWNQPRGAGYARIAVEARRASDGKWSGRNQLRILVVRKGGEVPDEQGEVFGAVDPDRDIAVDYNGPEVTPGPYTVRYRVHGDAGTTSAWEYDQSIVVEPRLPSPATDQ